MVQVTNLLNRTFYSQDDNEGTTDLTQDTITVAGNERDTRRVTVTDAEGFVVNPTAPAADEAVYNYLDLYTELLNVQTNSAAIFNDSQIHLLETVIGVASSGSQVERRSLGSQTFNRCTIDRVGSNSTAAAARVLLGPTGGGTWTTLNSTVVGHRNNQLALLYQNAPFANTSNIGLTLVGSVASEYSSAHTSLQTTWNNGGGFGQVADTATNPAIYTYRITQFNGTGGTTQTTPDNVSNIDAGAGTRNTALFVGDDLRNIATTGNDAAFGDGTSQTFLMINRKASHWIVGGRWDGTLPVGFHSGNRPFAGEPAEIRYIIPYAPSFIMGTGAELGQNTRIGIYNQLNSATLRFVEAPGVWDTTDPPVFDNATKQVSALDQVYWIEISRTIYNTNTDATSGVANPADVTPVPAILNAVVRARAYGVIIPENITVDALEQHGLVIGLTASLPTIIETAPDPSIFGVTEAEAEDFVDNTTDLTSIDQIYAAVQYDWAQNQSLDNAIAISTSSPGVLDFGSRNVTINPTVSFSVTDSQVNIPYTGTIDVTSNITTLMTTGTIVISGGITIGENLIVIDQNSPGANDIIFPIPQAWRDLTGAQYAVYNVTSGSSTFIADGLTTSLTEPTITVRGIGTNTVRIALVHPFRVDLTVEVTGSNSGVAMATIADPTENLLVTSNSGAAFSGSDTAATYFDVYTTLDSNLSGSTIVDPNDGSAMSIQTLVPTTGLRELNGQQGNNIWHNFKSNAFGSRYAKVLARQGTSPISAISRSTVASNTLIDFAFSHASVIETSVEINGTRDSAQVLVGSFTQPAPPDIDYDIIQGRVVTGATTAIENVELLTAAVLDTRGLTTVNMGNIGLLKPARDADGNILPGN